MGHCPWSRSSPQDLELEIPKASSRGTRDLALYLTLMEEGGPVRFAIWAVGLAAAKLSKVIDNNAS